MLFLALLIFCAHSAAGSLLSDHMVLQRGTSVPVFGRGEPGTSVKVRFQERAYETKIGQSGVWEVELKDLTEGGPFELNVQTGSSVQRFRDIAVGETWVCSGQSNMEYTLSRFPKSMWKDILDSTDENLRMYTAEKNAAQRPAAETFGSWKKASPLSTPGFSATCYFFGRELRKKLGVPVGLIASSWSGTSAESWTPPGPLFNGMIAPLFRFPIRGVVWYQGESNTHRAVQYKDLLRGLIQEWRNGWNRPDLPFYIVQLANYGPRSELPEDHEWAELREAQALVAGADSQSGLAVTIDIGDEDDIHPSNKQEVGRRLALLAFRKTYHQNSIIASGPVYNHFSADGTRIRLKFDLGGSSFLIHGKKIEGFAIAGEDRQFRWADAEMNGDEISVSHPEIPTPVAVRYAWGSNPACNVYNMEGLPTAPFRTDSWPLLTQDNR